MKPTHQYRKIRQNGLYRIVFLKAFWTFRPLCNLANHLKLFGFQRHLQLQRKKLFRHL